MRADPYLLPEGPVQVAFSGGRTSAKLVRKILDANGGLPDRAIVTFQNTSRELNESLDFVHAVEEWWRVPIVWLEYRPAGPCPLVGEVAEKYAEIFGRARLEHMQRWWAENASRDRFAVVNHRTAARSGEVFEALIFSRKFLPNQNMRFCTIEMKVRTAKRYLMSLGWTHWTNAVGFRADEPHRLNKPKPKDRWTVWHPMASAGVSKMDVSNFWRQQPFDLRLPNIKGKCWLGNCDGCFLKSEASVAAFTRDFPDRAAWWEGMETLVTWLTNSASAAFWSKRYTRAGMREYMERQGDWALSTEGALCQKGDGECIAA